MPVLKLVDRGTLRDDLWKLLLINSRTADLLDGDLRAMLGSTEVGAQRVTALVDELGIESYFDHLAGVLDHADAACAMPSRPCPTASISARTIPTMIASRSRRRGSRGHDGQE